MENFIELHNRGLEIVDRYKKSEAEVLSILQELDQTKTYLHYGCTSLFDYSMKFHKMTESVTLNFIAVSRRAVQVPELKAAIDIGDLTVSKARKITSVITPETQSSWISKAINLSSRALEKEVARVQPQALTPEKAKYVTESRININFGLSEEFYKKLKRVQDLESQRLSRAASLEEAQEVMLDLYLEKKDPVERAKRNLKPKENDLNTAGQGPGSPIPYVTGHVNKKSRMPIPSQLRHQINLRDKGKCSEPNCNQGRWIDIHHIIPVSQGGENTLENLKILCSGHHKIEHLEKSN